MSQHVERPAAKRCTGDGTIAANDDRRLLSGDCLDRVSEIALMIESNVGDHGDAAVPRVHCVEPSTESDLDHRCLHLLFAQGFEYGTDQQLELRGGTDARFDAIRRLERTIDCARELEGADRSAVDLESFAI